MLECHGMVYSNSNVALRQAMATHAAVFLLRADHDMSHDTYYLLKKYTSFGFLVMSRYESYDPVDGVDRLDGGTTVQGTMKAGKAGRSGTDDARPSGKKWPNWMMRKKKLKGLNCDE